MISLETKLEIGIYIARKTGWTLDYIGEIPIDKLISIYGELVFQESAERWEWNYNFATLLATICNTIPGRRKTFTHKDFFDVSKPSKTGKPEEIDVIDSMAQKAGIRLPEE